MTESELVRKFKERGYKVTPQRRAIIKVVTSSLSHPSAEEIHKVVLERMPDVSLATVYNTLRKLVAIGEAYELVLDCGVRRYELTSVEHVHLVCLECGRIQDLAGDWGKLKSLFPFDTDFCPVRYDVTIYGCCAECRSLGGSVSC